MHTVNRAEITEGAELIETDLDTHIGHVIAAMQEVSDDLGL